MAEKCVLLVDDDDGIRAVLGEILESEGYRVVYATDGAEALEHLRGGLRPSLILLDLMMPGMNGWEFHEIQMKDPVLRAIPVVVLTGVDRPKKQTAMLDVGDVLSKPVDLDLLLSVVQRRCQSSVV